MLDLDRTPTMMGYNNDMFAGGSRSDEDEGLQAALTYKSAMAAAINRVSGGHLPFSFSTLLPFQKHECMHMYVTVMK